MQLNMQLTSQPVKFLEKVFNNDIKINAIVRYTANPKSALKLLDSDFPQDFVKNQNHNTRCRRDRIKQNERTEGEKTINIAFTNLCY